MADLPHGSRSHMTLPLPFVPDIHLACWQGNLARLKALLRANNTVLTSQDIELSLLLPFGVPNCLRANGSRCPQAKGYNDSEKAASESAKVPMTTQSQIPALLKSSLSVSAQMCGSACRPQLSSLSLGSQTGRMSPYRIKSKLSLSTASQEMGASIRGHSQCPKVWGDPAQLALASGSVRCANFVLAILLVRKLLRVGVITSENSMVSDVWNQNPKHTILDAVDKITKDLALVAPATKEYLLPSHNKSEAKCTVIAACALGQAPVIRAIRFRKDVDFSVFSSSCRSLIVTSLLGGDRETVREILEWLVPSMTGDEMVAACCQTLELARLYDNAELASMVTVLGEFYPQKFQTPIVAFLEGMYGLLNHFIWIKERRDEPEDSQVIPWDPWQSEHIIITYAPFFLRPPEMSAPGRLGIDYIEPKYVHALLDKREWNILPISFRKQYGHIFTFFCQRERAAWVLLQSENEELLQFIPESAIHRVLLTLVQHIYVATEKYPFKRKCDLCSRPILSFVLWLLDKPNAISRDTLDEIICYCSPSDLDYCASRLASLRHGPLCAYHRFGVLCKLTRIIASTHERKRQAPLSTRAVLVILRSLKGESDNLQVSELPTHVQSYFYLKSTKEKAMKEGIKVSQ